MKNLFLTGRLFSVVLLSLILSLLFCQCQKEAVNTKTSDEGVVMIVNPSAPDMAQIAEAMHTAALIAVKNGLEADLANGNIIDIKNRTRYHLNKFLDNYMAISFSSGKKPQPDYVIQIKNECSTVFDDCWNNVQQTIASGTIQVSSFSVPLSPNLTFVNNRIHQKINLASNYNTIYNITPYLEGVTIQNGMIASASEQKVIDVAFSILRSSASYWDANGSQWDEMLSYRRPRLTFQQWKSIIYADVFGGLIGGAIGGPVLGIGTAIVASLAAAAN